ncbi:MAG: hypothetical protein JSV86_15320 [Gemmatimonadota bacterium]|nr:MAG: hypothetical protein JSV86_15320 [Gemmatimonadota bacterium]
MVHSDDDRRIDELELLRTPQRSDAARRAARLRILASAELPLARRRRTSSSWEVLAAWGRPGLVAASIALAVLAGALQPWQAWQGDLSQPVVLEDVLSGAAESDGLPAMLVALTEPDAEAVAAAALLERNGNGADVPENVEQR